MNKTVRHVLTFKKRFRPLVQIVCIGIILCSIYNAPAFSEGTESALWDALKSGGHVALLRHALAPGTGDPPNFQLGLCPTQRNLSDEGRDQARTIGGLFRKNGIHAARVFSSQWCRCMETAKLLALGPVEELPVLNSFFRHYERRESQTRMMLEWLGEQSLERPTVLVTHQVNITALTGIYPDSGELIIVHRSPNGKIKVIGTIESR